MNHAFIRPGGVAQDLPDGAIEQDPRVAAATSASELDGLDKLLRGQPIWVSRLKDVGWIGVEGCLALGVTGPMLRAAGLPWDLRKTEPYLGYETFDFEVPTYDRGDCWSRFLVRVAEMRESLKIVEQVLDRLEPGPVDGRRPEDRLAGPAVARPRRHGQLARARRRRSWARSMESLIHHFKLVTEGFRVPAGQVYTAVESPRGELGAHVVSDGGTRPYRVHLREPSFINLQSTAALSDRRPDR